MKVIFLQIDQPYIFIIIESTAVGTNEFIFIVSLTEAERLRPILMTFIIPQRHREIPLESILTALLLA
jgi:hypothetical protein